jgi:putative ABC transport system permease protein
VTDNSIVFAVFRRHKVRTLFTVLSVTVAFAIFLVIAALHAGYGGLLNYAQSQRLIVLGESLQLPVSYAAKIAALPGVKAVDYQTGFYAIYREPKNGVWVQAAPFPANLIVNPERKLTAAARHAMLMDRQGAVVGAELARKMGWKVGDTIPLSNGPAQTSGSTTWYFHLHGIFESDLPKEKQQDFVTHYEYVNEGRADISLKDRVAMIYVFINDARDISRVAHLIDAKFAASQPSTLTVPEQFLAASVVKSVGDIGSALIAVAAAVFFSMLLVAGNTMANSVRQRVHEFALMRALGFSRWRLAGLVVKESAVLIGMGTVLGLTLGWWVCRLMTPIISASMPYFAISSLSLLLGVLLAGVFLCLISIFPARRATSLPVADTLRRV